MHLHIKNIINNVVTSETIHQNGGGFESLEKWQESLKGRKDLISINNDQAIFKIDFGYKIVQFHYEFYETPEYLKVICS